ncbi:MAG: hypothetical protein ACI4RG_03850 [Huintestinicola sp.]
MHTKKNRERAYSQNDLVTDIFIDHYESSDHTYYDSTSISHWIKGNRPVPAAIVRTEPKILVYFSLKNNIRKRGLQHDRFLQHQSVTGGVYLFTTDA